MRGKHSIWKSDIPFWFGYVLASLGFNIYYLAHTAIMTEANQVLLTNFAARKPFQFRVLLPIIVRLFHGVFPLPVDQYYILLSLVFTAALFFSYRAYLRIFVPDNAARWLAFTLLIPLVAVFSDRWYYPYDIPSAFFITVGLTLLAQRRWTAYYVLLAIATVNRETSVCLIWAFLFTQWGQLSKSRYAAHLVGQTLLWGAICAVIRWIFRNNPGEGMEWHVASNIDGVQYLLRHPDLVIYATVTTLLALVSVACWTRNTQPPFLRRALLVCLPFMAAMTIAGYWFETRIYSEIISILLASVNVGLYWRYAKNPEARREFQVSPQRVAGG